ncbi:MAG TPA: FkbM family methyltransferase, partial [Flavobacteriales bacterium]|nr:FkbM family methyltransferase [Flavobacteriales bacterium]
ADGAGGWEGQVWDRAIEVPVTTLDRLIDQYGRPAFVKIDVEGFEDEVLVGSEAIIQRDRPVLFIEVIDANLKENSSSARTLVDRLNGWGYTVEEAISGRTIDATQDLTDCSMDVVCKPV